VVRVVRVEEQQEDLVFLPPVGTHLSEQAVPAVRKVARALEARDPRLAAREFQISEEAALEMFTLMFPVVAVVVILVAGLEGLAMAVEVAVLEVAEVAPVIATLRNVLP
jgi:hypothetical protein